MLPRYWHETAHLGLTHERVLWHLTEDVDGNAVRVLLGPIERADVPAGLGLEPELAALLDALLDAFDPAEEAGYAYDRSRGRF